MSTWIPTWHTMLQWKVVDIWYGLSMRVKGPHIYMVTTLGLYVKWPPNHIVESWDHALQPNFLRMNHTIKHIHFIYKVLCEPTNCLIVFSMTCIVSLWWKQWLTMAIGWIRLTVTVTWAIIGMCWLELR